MKPLLLIMLKTPVAGRVKTRLGREIGMTAAAWWFRHQSAALIRNLQSPRWETRLLVAPDSAVNGRFWPGHVPRMAQGRGGLGARMKRGLRASKGRVVLIGADIPGVQQTDIAAAFALLGRHDLVFGPATDGGFWLVGKRGPLPPGLFAHVRWSRRDTLAQTIASAGKGLRIGYCPTRADVDHAADLPRGPHAPQQP